LASISILIGSYSITDKNIGNNIVDLGLSVCAHTEPKNLTIVLCRKHI